MNKPKVVAVVGTNASGKSALGVRLAGTFDGEIISADSRQVSSVRNSSPTRAYLP